MLRNIHKASSTWLGKAVMATVLGILAISFVIWGIGDNFLRFGQDSLAEIGGTKASIEEFRRYYNERLQFISRQEGRVVTPAQARARGLDQQILTVFLREAALDEQTKRLKLGLSDADIIQHITTDPAFRGPNGAFDPARFEQVIRQGDFTEARYAAEQRRLLLRAQIGQTIGGNVTPPQSALAAINQFQNERRDIDYLMLGPAQAGDIAAPTDEQLKSYFEERKTLFRAPEYRKVTLLLLSPAKLAKPDAVSEEEAKTYYEQHKDKYGRPEKREVRQIAFQNETEAMSARARIASGASFDEIAKERGLNASDTDLGLITKADIIDSAIAEAAFSLNPGEVSQPVKGNFATALLIIGKVEPGEQKPFGTLAPQIKQEIAETRARSEINDVRDKVEDERAGGATLAETAEKIGLASITIEAVDRAGRDPNGKTVADLAARTNVITSIFASDVGVDNEALQMADGSYLYFEVNGITPSRERELAEVKIQAEARWRDDEIARRLRAKADEMLAHLKAGGTLAQLASENALSVQKAVNLQRGQVSTAAPEKLLIAAFTTAKGAPGSTEGERPAQRFVFIVKEVTIPAFDASSLDGRQLAGALKTAYSNDIVSEYIAKLENDFGITINPTALNQVIGGPAQ